MKICNLRLQLRCLLIGAQVDRSHQLPFPTESIKSPFLLGYIEVVRYVAYRLPQAIGTDAEAVVQGRNDGAQSLFSLLALRFGADPVLASVRQGLLRYAL